MWHYISVSSNQTITNYNMNYCLFISFSTRDKHGHFLNSIFILLFKGNVKRYLLLGFVLKWYPRWKCLLLFFSKNLTLRIPFSLKITLSILKLVTLRFLILKAKMKIFWTFPSRVEFSLVNLKMVIDSMRKFGNIEFGLSKNRNSKSLLKVRSLCFSIFIE